LAASVVLSTPSFAWDRNFALANDTDRTIVGAWLSTPGDNIWHPISGDVLRPHGQNAITFNGKNGPCYVQLRIKFSDNTSHEWRNGFDVCAVNQITIYWDENDEAYEADYQ
jgi:hypothetical protein